MTFYGQRLARSARGTAAVAATVAFLVFKPYADGLRTFDVPSAQAEEGKGKDDHIRALGSKSPQARLASVQGLMEFRDEPDAKSALIGALDDPDSRVRKMATNVVGWMHDTAVAIPAIVRLMDDANPSVREKAVMVLGTRHYDNRQVFEAIVRKTEDSDARVRRTALERLTRPTAGDFRDLVFSYISPDSTKRNTAVAKRLSDGSLAIGLMAAEWFGFMPLGFHDGWTVDMSAVPALVRLLRNPQPELRLAAVTALGHARVPIQVPWGEIERTGNPEPVYEGFRKDKAFMPAVLKMIVDGDVKISIEAIALATRTKDSRAIGYLQPIAERLDAGARAHAWWAIRIIETETSDRSAVPWLMRKLGEHEHVLNAHEAMRLLAMIKERRALAALNGLKNKTKDSCVRSCAAQAVADIDPTPSNIDEARQELRKGLARGYSCGCE